MKNVNIKSEDRFFASFVIVAVALIAFLFSISAYAQNTEPTPFYFMVYNHNDSIARQLTADSLKQNSILIGPQWGAHPKMAKALKFNTIHSWAPNPDDVNGQSHYSQFYINDTGARFNYIIGKNPPHNNAQGFKYKPTWL
ncbi:MAG: hypothetical protein NT007_06820 [Candidatus Kapabacteria bacterium]|nr:hypothetical protein [Candidatus Kapabacteria bacterium]